jgi:hypothetical protein
MAYQRLLAAIGLMVSIFKSDDRLRPGDTLIVLGSRGQIECLEQLMHGEEVT